MDKKVFVKGPDPTLKLAYSDVWLSGLYSRRVLVFETPAGSSHARAVDILERALQSLVDGTPELGSLSVIVPEADHDGKTPWRALAPYKGIEFIVKDLTRSFSSFAELQRGGFPISAFKDRLLMPIPFRIEPAPQPQTKVQASLIEGGLLLSVCIFHHLTDGNGMNTIVRALGRACALAASDPTTPLPPVVLNTDRTRMLTLQGDQTSLSHHLAHRHVPDVYRPRPGTAPRGVPSAQPTLSSTATSFRLSSPHALQLKSVAAGDGGAAEEVSTHDAITALLWRTLVLARHHAGHLGRSDTAVFSFPVDARRHLGLPADWVGNCVYFCVVEREVSGFLAPAASPSAGEGGGEGGVLRSVAAQIHAARIGVDARRVEGVMTARREDPFSLAWWPAGRVGDPKVLVFTSFYHSGMLEGDWGEAGLGRVRHYTSTDVGAMAGGFERTAFVGPRREGGRGCDVTVGVDERELEFFRGDEMWKRYFVGLGE